MRVLAIETSGRHGSLATLRGENEDLTTVGQTMLTGEGRTAQSLAPALQSLLGEAGWPANSIELVTVAIGPGSFTGLRIGVTTAKTFAYATNAGIVGVNTLAVIARQAPASAAPLWTIMDAQRGELFAARFDPTAKGDLVIAREPSIIAQDTWIAELRSGDRVTGPTARRVLPQLPGRVTVVSEEHWQPTAAFVGRVGWHSYRAGQRDDIWKLVPHYYRLSAAEERVKGEG